jgi:phage gpG-like protein
VFLVREIKRGIRSQAPGGQQFVKLAQATIDAKGSSKALIDTGFLMNSVTMKLMPDHAYVGLLASAANKDGDSLAMIGAIMEYGATIQHPSGATIIIPPRPFLHPVMEKYRPQVIENYRQAIAGVLGGQSDPRHRRFTSVSGSILAGPREALRVLLDTFKPTFLIQIEGQTLAKDITQEITEFAFEDNEEELDAVTGNIVVRATNKVFINP